jgi:hypothetical protein
MTSLRRPVTLSGYIAWLRAKEPPPVEPAPEAAALAPPAHDTVRCPPPPPPRRRPAPMEVTVNKLLKAVTRVELQARALAGEEGARRAVATFWATLVAPRKVRCPPCQRRTKAERVALASALITPRAGV